MSTWRCKFNIIPQAKQSTRFAAKNGRVFSFTPANKRSYQQQLAAIALSVKPETLFTGPVVLKAKFWWGFPASWSNKKKFVQPKISRPDLDNLLKPLKDALRGVVFIDDSQVVSYELCGKWYGPTYGIDVEVFEFGGVA